MNDEIPSDTIFATSGELAKALGMQDDEAKAFENRLEYLVGNKPKIIAPINSDKK